MGSTEETYIFFDIESSNSIGGDGHICSFGYVICDQNFNVIEKEDIVMNPRSEFEPVLLDPRSKCQLAYSKEYFLSQPDFSFYYERIKNLLTSPGRKAIGFAVENDIDFLVCACNHFNLPQYDFSAYDSRMIAERLNNIHNGLSSWLKFYEVKTDSLTAHKSCDDAEMTMLLVQKMCLTKKMHIKEFLSSNFYALRSVRQDIERRYINTIKKTAEEKIRELYYKKNPTPLSTKLSGRYKLNLSRKRDYDQKVDFARLIYNNGGVIVEKIDSNCFYVMEDSRKKTSWMENPKFKSVKFITVSELFRQLEIEPWPFKKL
ncbi:MAG: hypothetical protein J5857_07815, partial [Treponema sp.]|nr:hypothetical protein [Treponema sp.]